MGSQLYSFISNTNFATNRKRFWTQQKNTYYKSVNFFVSVFVWIFILKTISEFPRTFLPGPRNMTRFGICYCLTYSAVLTFVSFSLRRRSEISVYTAWGWCRCVRDLLETTVVPDRLMRLARTKRCTATEKTTPEICTLRTGSRRFKSESIVVWVNHNIPPYPYDLSNLETLIEYACDNVFNSIIKPIF